MVSDQVTIDVQVATTVRKPREAVASVMFDPRFAPAWAGAEAVRPLSTTPLQPGARMEWIARSLGRRYFDVREVLHHVPERALEFGARHPFLMSIRYELEGIPEGVIARVSARGNPTGIMRFLMPLLRMRLRRKIVGDLHRLKRLMESNAFRARAGYQGAEGADA